MFEGSASCSNEDPEGCEDMSRSLSQTTEANYPGGGCDEDEADGRRRLRVCRSVENVGDHPVGVARNDPLSSEKVCRNVQRLAGYRSIW